MGRLAGFKYAEVSRKLRSLGFKFDRQAKGSYEIWRHELTGKKVTVPHHRREVAEGTLRAILRQSEIEVDDFLDA